MCGIVGLLNPGMPGTETLDCLGVMANRIRHRGPDSDGFLVRPEVGLGIRRLKIIDLSSGDQPIFNEDETIATVFNGEIYNFTELREELRQKGHVFRTATDTEVIVHQYEEDGVKCVERFRGMFSFALWDAAEKRLLLARDRFGIKPLFVAEHDGRLGFASEIKALTPLPWVDRTWDPRALEAYLRLGYVPAPLSAFRGIRKFEQGTTELWGLGDPGRPRLLSRTKYWEPRVVSRQRRPSFGAAREELRAHLVESVRLRLRSDVPLGAFLSGGVDSTSVVALMRHCGIEHMRTFSIGFEDERFNELPYAEQAAQHLGTEHHTRVVTGSDALAVVDLVSGYDEPFADSSAIPTYFVSRLAREHVTVSLSGDGGDELFGGYSQYPAVRRFGRLFRIPAALRRPLSLLGSSLLPEGRRGAGFVRRLGSNPDETLLNLETRSLSGLLAGALSPAFLAFLENDGAPSTAAWEAAFRGVRTVSQAQAVDQRYYLADDILVKVDRASMAVSLEGRVPLLDHRLAEFVNSLPERFKLAGTGSKRILKSVMAGDMPRGFFDRPKKGFGVPLRTWLTGPLSPVVEEVFRDNPAGVFSSGGAKALLQAMRDGTRDLSGEVWALFVLGLWARNEAASKPW